MERIEKVNQEEVLDVLRLKLVRDYDKLLKKIPKKQLTEGQEIVLDTLTMGDKKNDGLIAASLAVPGVPIAIGVGKALVGMIGLIPSATQPVGEEAITFFQKASDFSQRTLNSGVGSLVSGIKLLAIPAGVATISLGVRLYRELVDKRINNAKYSAAIVQLIDDIQMKKQDPTLSFAYKLFGRVDLTGIDQKLVTGLLKYLAYYRYVLKMKENGKMTEDDVEKAYDDMILYIKELSLSSSTPEKFSNNRFIKNLIMDYDERKYNEEILSVSHAK